MAAIGPPGQRLSFAQLEQLWISNGGNPSSAPIMAAIAIAESGGLTNNLNDKAPDYSVGLWQINYFGNLRSGRTSSYGTPEQLAADPNRQARAAISISNNGKNLSPWTTYPTAAQAVLRSQGAALPTIASLPALTSPAATQGAASVDNEGLLFKVHIPATDFDLKMGRGTARKMVGSVVLVGGGVVGLAGVFVLVGGRTSLPGVGGMVKQVRTASVERRASRAAASASETSPDELAERRATRSREGRERTREGASRSARAQGERDAEAAGNF